MQLLLREEECSTLGENKAKTKQLIELAFQHIGHLVSVFRGKQTSRKTLQDEETVASVNITSNTNSNVGSGNGKRMPEESSVENDDVTDDNEWVLV